MIKCKCYVCKEEYKKIDLEDKDDHGTLMGLCPKHDPEQK